MTFFVDANVFVYSATQGPHREACAEAILSADAGFDSVDGLRRVDPLDRAGMAGPLAG